MRSARSGSSLIEKIAAVGARHEPVVDGELVGEVPALGDLDGVDLADQVGDRRVGRGELLAEAAVAVHPLDRRLVAALGDEHARVLRDRVVRVVVDLAAGDDRHPLVEQLGERADHAGLRLPALAEEDHVVAGDQRVLELREDGVLVADHAVDELLALRDPRDRVGAHLFFDGPRHPSAGLELAEGSGTRHQAISSNSKASWRRRAPRYQRASRRRPAVETPIGVGSATLDGPHVICDGPPVRRGPGVVPGERRRRRAPSSAPACPRAPSTASGRRPAGASWSPTSAGARTGPRSCADGGFLVTQNGGLDLSHLPVLRRPATAPVHDSRACSGSRPTGRSAT